MTNEAENDFVWETRAARDSIDGEGRESARGQQHFLLSVMGSVNRPNLGICTSSKKKEADEVGNKTATGIRSGRRPRGRKAPSSPPSPSL